MATGLLEGPWWASDREARERVGRAFHQACGGVPVSYEEKARLFGQDVEVSLSLNPVTGPDGRVAYVVAEGRDVTALKSAEARLQQRSRELEALNQELEAFTYSVSHDLRAPLRAVAGFARILEEDHASSLDGDGLGHLRRIVDGARQMGVLIDDLLNLSRIGRAPVDRQPTDLSALVEEARRKVEPESGARNIEWRFQALPVLACDARLVGQVFVNLLSNAVKYTRPRDRAVIAVGAETRDGETVVFVRDNGVGFDMKYVHKLFGVFQRLHDRDSFEGTGVGLATVQRIVHRHGGRLWAEAAVDQGASFYFTLGADGRGGAPRAPAAAGEPEAIHDRSR
jgi:light-regulated signal transduction histidine kinase (bacteriophytochrome)